MILSISVTVHVDCILTCSQICMHLRGGTGEWFHNMFQEIIAKRSADVQHEVRWLATVYFKNSITRHWRARPDM